MNVLLIPAYQPTEALPALVKACQEKGLGPIVVVNDGSDARKRPIFDALKALGCTVAEHKSNQGKGAALKTGLRTVEKDFPEASAVITADADGQHLSEDIQKIAFLLETHSAVLGVRDFRTRNVPFRSRFGNRLSTLFFRLLTGMSCPDTQTGLRGFAKEYFPLLLSCEGERYEYEMNVLIELADRKVPLYYTPIETVYSKGNASSHFRPLRDSLRIYRNSLRFVLSSLSCSVVDLSIFSLSHLLLGDLIYNILLSTVIARLISGTANFTINKKWSFSSKGKAKKEFVRYCVLFFAQMFSSYLLVQLLSVLPLPAPLWKIPVDCLLFLLSFFIQRRWVYRKEEIDA